MKIYLDVHIYKKVPIYVKELKFHSKYFAICKLKCLLISNYHSICKFFVLLKRNNAMLGRDTRTQYYYVLYV